MDDRKERQRKKKQSKEACPGVIVVVHRDMALRIYDTFTADNMYNTTHPTIQDGDRGGVVFVLSVAKDDKYHRECSRLMVMKSNYGEERAQLQGEKKVQSRAEAHTHTTEVVIFV